MPLSNAEQSVSEIVNYWCNFVLGKCKDLMRLYYEDNISRDLIVLWDDFCIHLYHIDEFLISLYKPGTYTGIDKIMIDLYGEESDEVYLFYDFSMKYTLRENWPACHDLDKGCKNDRLRKILFGE